MPPPSTVKNAPPLRACPHCLRTRGGHGTPLSVTLPCAETKISTYPCMPEPSPLVTGAWHTTTVAPPTSRVAREQTDGAVVRSGAVCWAVRAGRGGSSPRKKKRCRGCHDNEQRGAGERPSEGGGGACRRSLGRRGTSPQNHGAVGATTTR